ncbi:MAG: hypothetical protein ACRCYS_01180 [Beijerinckiaceae bacterium]
MTCDNQLGVRNILIKFTDCDSGAVFGPINHELSGDTQPTYRLCDYANEPLPGGYVRRTRGNNEISVMVVRNLGIPLAMYQGCGAIDLTIEHFNGMVITGVNGTSTGTDSSDGHEVTITATFKEVDELLPNGPLAA